MQRPGHKFRGWRLVAIAHVEAVAWPARGTPTGTSYPVANTRWRARIAGPADVPAITSSECGATVVMSAGDTMRVPRDTAARRKSVARRRGSAASWS